MSYTPFYIGHDLPLLTDFYEITMAYAHWKSGTLNVPAVFTLTFRSNPFKGGYTVAAGLESAIQYLENFKISDSEIAFLAGLRNTDDRPLFAPEFLRAIKNVPFNCDVWAVPEGSVVFPHEPILKVSGPIWQCQWVESALLNIINFQSLIATKSTRMVYAARGGKVVEFGLRRAQGFDGALSASRAAYLGGVSATSNILAAKLFGIPVAGTHAHSWVMAFASEIEAFRKYAAAFPESSIFLVDTYDTDHGIKNAITVGQELAGKGHKLRGVRLDSGDLAFLSEAARNSLDAAGMQTTEIVASNELDEYLIQSLHLQGAKVDVWGVGTKLVTAQDQPALGGVYKLSAIYENETWVNKIKISNQPAKISNPGRHQLRRFYNEKNLLECDLIYDESEDPNKVTTLHDPVIAARTKIIQKNWRFREVLEKVFSAGRRARPSPKLSELQDFCKSELAALHPGHRRFENPHEYRVGLSPGLSRAKAELIAAAEGKANEGHP